MNREQQHGFVSHKIRTLADGQSKNNQNHYFILFISFKIEIQIKLLTTSVPQHELNNQMWRDPKIWRSTKKPTNLQIHKGHIKLWHKTISNVAWAPNYTKIIFKLLILNAFARVDVTKLLTVFSLLFHLN